MIHNVILSKDNLDILSINPSKTIFWVGAGVGADSPCNLPLGNVLTDAFLYAMLGDKAEDFILYWNNYIPAIRDCVRNGIWSEPLCRTQYTVADVKSGEAWERPRLEFVIGEVNKLDQEFCGISFENPENVKRYRRQQSIESLAHFAEAEPNLLHYWLADFARAGAMIITANFDICIEKAIDGDNKLSVCDGVKGIETGAGFIYHFHGVATDEDMQNNLGATVNNISKRLPERFTDRLVKYFEDGYDIVFVGYSGLDFFDVYPFFKELQTGEYPGKALYLDFCLNDKKCEEALKMDKHYEYLLSPFKEGVIAYGLSTIFFDIIGRNSGISCSKEISEIPKTVGTAFDAAKKQLHALAAGMDTNDVDTFYFLNMFRLTSQLNINPVNFYPDWGERIKTIYNDWKNDSNVLQRMFSTTGQINECIVDDIRFNNWGSKNDDYLSVVADIRYYIDKWDVRHRTALSDHMSWRKRGAEKKQIDEFVDRTCEILKQGAYTMLSPEEQDIERDTVHYLCGWQTKKIYVLWAIPIVRYVVYLQLRYLKGKIEQLLQYPFNYFMYRTYYLSLCRQLGAIRAMLGENAEDNGFYGNIQQEWDICMETPNLFDARMTIRARLRQFWIMVFKLKLGNVGKYKALKAIYRELDRMREDSTLRK